MTPPRKATHTPASLTDGRLDPRGSARTRFVPVTPLSPAPAISDLTRPRAYSVTLSAGRNVLFDEIALNEPVFSPLAGRSQAEISLFAHNHSCIQHPSLQICSGDLGNRESLQQVRRQDLSTDVGAVTSCRRARSFIPGHGESIPLSHRISPYRSRIMYRESRDELLKRRHLCK